MIENLQAGLELVADPTTIFAIVAASLYGLFMGAMPGLTATMAMALMLPFLIFAPTPAALAAVIAMHAMAITSGDFPAVFLRIPGTPASAAYVEDAYALTLKGRGFESIGILVLGSALGGLVGVVALAFGAPLFATLATSFTSFEYFWLATLGLCTAIVISSGSLAKGLISTGLGLALSCVGLDVGLGYPRFTFGTQVLLGGIDLVAVMIGAFGLSQVLRHVAGEAQGDGAGQPNQASLQSMTKGSLRPIIQAFRDHPKEFIRGSVLGTIVGAMPGAGPDIASYVSYAATKNASKDKSEFGTGSIKALVSVSAGNNAALAGAWIPTLTLGIPGDAGTAMLLGLFLIHGVQPGPQLFENNAPLLYSVLIVFAITNLLLLPFGYLGMRLSARVLRTSQAVLLPLIVMTCIAGAFASNNGMFEIGLMAVMGVVGYFLERYGFSVAPLLLGLILGPIIERSFVTSMMKTDWNPAQFLTRPISAGLAIATVLFLVGPRLRLTERWFRRWRNESGKGPE